MNIIRAGDTRLKALDRQRQAIGKLSAEIATTRAASYPRTETSRLVRNQLQADEDRSIGIRERFGKVIDPVNRDAPWPELTVLNVYGIDSVHAGIMAQIDSLNLPDDGLSPAERIKRLESEQFRAEAEEELLICRLEAEHHAHILRRVDADPLAILAAWEKAA